MITPFKKNISLKPFNTFGIDVVADYWIEIFHSDDIAKLLDTDLYRQFPHYVLGGGSNVLFPDDYHGIIIKNSIPGVTVISENDHYVFLRVGAGIIWDNLVLHCLKKGWGGIENLSMIPGQTGAAPIQNIGAYGVELESVFVSLEAMHMKNGIIEVFNREMCRFGYRDSIFKRTCKDQYIITTVTLKLHKKPQVNISYKPLMGMLTEKGVNQPTIQDVSRVVREIRSSKLPDPVVTGNAGSFFKNPIISAGRFAQLQNEYQDIPGFPVMNLPGSLIDNDPLSEADHVPEYVKIPAAWLIEMCGFKGMRDGDAGIHKQHALILVNHGHATGEQILGIARNIREKVQEKFGIMLDPEVNIVNCNLEA